MGDRGKTTLAGGQKVSKSSLRIAAYGGVDELIAYLGLIVQLMGERADLAKIGRRIVRIQNELFNLGSQLAVLPEDRRENTPVIHDGNITQLEREIEEMNAHLPPLNSFLLPGGDLIEAHLHIARTVCRRVERDVVRLGETEKPDGTEIPYLNRLSDWLFVTARYVMKLLGKEERLWQQRGE